MMPIPDRPDLNTPGGPDYGILCLMLAVAIMLAVVNLYGGGCP